MPKVPRLRMFAGPNGSGKSTLKTVLPDKLLGVYLNADDIEAEINKTGKYKFDLEMEVDAQRAKTFFEQSTLLSNKGLIKGLDFVQFSNAGIDFSAIEINSYYASVLVAFMRELLLELGRSFTIETVMSHPSKVGLLQSAQELGFRTYLYYIATEDPLINQSRVDLRVDLGGHAVPPQKIEDRYYRSLNLLTSAISHTNRTYLFDNSTEDEENTWLIEITNGTEFEWKVEEVPLWCWNNLPPEFTGA